MEIKQLPKTGDYDAFEIGFDQSVIIVKISRSLEKILGDAAMNLLGHLAEKIDFKQFNNGKYTLDLDTNIIGTKEDFERLISGKNINHIIKRYTERD